MGKPAGYALNVCRTDSTAAPILVTRNHKTNSLSNANGSFEELLRSKVPRLGILGRLGCNTRDDDNY